MKVLLYAVFKDHENVTLSKYGADQTIATASRVAPSKLNSAAATNDAEKRRAVLLNQTLASIGRMIPGENDIVCGRLK
jgi:hypothetical protein